MAGIISNGRGHPAGPQGKRFDPWGAYGRRIHLPDNQYYVIFISAVYPLLAATDVTGGPARYYRMSDSNSRIGFISPHSHNFCDTCNRVRVTVEGRLLLCLGNEHSADLKAPLRNFLHDDQPLIDTLFHALPLKPERHHFDLAQEPQIVRFMNMTGG